MIARAALCNPMIFSSTTVYDRQTVIIQYLNHVGVLFVFTHFALNLYQCASTSARFENTKYTVQRMLEGEQQTSDCGRRLLGAATLTEIFDIWNIVSGTFFKITEIFKPFTNNLKKFLQPIPASCVASIELTTTKSRKRPNSQSECELLQQNQVDLVMDINVPM
jgi:hypothetical protein